MPAASLIKLGVLAAQEGWDRHPPTHISACRPNEPAASLDDWRCNYVLLVAAPLAQAIVPSPQRRQLRPAQPKIIHPEPAMRMHAPGDVAQGESGSGDKVVPAQHSLDDPPGLRRLLDCRGNRSE